MSFISKNTLLPAILILNLFCNSPALAWDCDVHLGLELLSNLSLYPDAEFPASTEKLNPTEMCKKYKRPPNKKPADYNPDKIDRDKIFEDLIYGSQDPDKYKYDNIKFQIEHDLKARESAINAFMAAVNAYKRGYFYGFRYSAPRQLAHALHYVEDLGDPSRERDSLGWFIDKGGLGRNKRHFLDLANETIRNLVSSQNKPSRIFTSFRVKLRDAKLKMEGKNLEQIIAALERFRPIERGRVQDIYRNHGRQRGTPLLEKEILETFAMLVAAKEEIFVLFNNSISKVTRPSFNGVWRVYWQVWWELDIQASNGSVTGNIMRVKKNQNGDFAKDPKWSKGTITGERSNDVKIGKAPPQDGIRGDITIEREIQKWDSVSRKSYPKWVEYDLKKFQFRIEKDTRLKGEFCLESGKCFSVNGEKVLD